MQNEFGTLKEYSPVLFDSRDPMYKSPFGAVNTRQKVTILFPVHVNLKAKEVKLFLRRNEDIVEYPLQFYEEKTGYDFYGIEIIVGKAGTYFYRFEIYSDDKTYYCGKGNGGQGVIGEWLPEWQLSVYNSQYSTSDFLKGGVVYHIFVDRFNCVNAGIPRFGVKKNWEQDVTICDSDGIYRANDFYCGNFDGIIEKINYLKSLGITALYLSPIFESNSNHRYDTADYGKVDTLLGGEEGFERLIRACDEHKIAIILDGVFNHTGADSLYFNKFGHYDSIGAYQSENSKYFNWYTFFDFPQSYLCWWGCTNVPTVARDAVGYQDMIAGENGVIEKRIKQGVKGWRLDVVDEISEFFVKKIRDRIKKTDSDATIIGEVWEDASTKHSYGEERQYFYGDDLDGVMNYVFKDAINDYILYSDGQAFVERVLSIMENYPKESLAVSFTLIDSHDTVRAINAYSGVNISQMSKEDRKNYRLTKEEYAIGKARLMVASAIQYFLPGVPSLYYGDEAGLQGFEDPINRRTYPWGNEDTELLTHYRNLGAFRSKYREDFVSGEITVASKGDEIVIKRGQLMLIANAKKVIFDIIILGE